MGMKAPEILERGAQHMRDRAASRDQAGGERSMLRTVTAFNALTGHALSERDGWLFMVALKAARACTTETGLPDDYEDGAAYFGLAGESAAATLSTRAALPTSGEVLDRIRGGNYSQPQADRAFDANTIPSDRVVALGGTVFPVPRGYRYVAQDANGTVWAYGRKPFHHVNCWGVTLGAEDGMLRLGIAVVRDTQSWRESLVDLLDDGDTVAAA